MNSAYVTNLANLASSAPSVNPAARALLPMLYCAAVHAGDAAHGTDAGHGDAGHAVYAVYGGDVESGAGHGGAPTVHKCTVDGKVTYSDTPCQQGTASVLAVPDAPAPDKAATDLKRAKKQSDALAKQRHQREAADDKADASASRAAAARQQRCDRLMLDRKWAEEDLRRAQPQHEEQARIKARRAADKAKLGCA